MFAIADVCYVPIGVGVSLSSYIAQAQKIFKSHNLKIHMHAYGTNIEGELDTIFAAIKECHDKFHAMGAPRVSSSIRLGTRVDREQHMEDKINSVEQKLLSTTEGFES